MLAFLFVRQILGMQGLELAQKFEVLGMQTYLYSTLGEIAMADGEDAQAEF
jgi:hypothetical protein